jgi:hypothetical protein
MNLSLASRHGLSAMPKLSLARTKAKKSSFSLVDRLRLNHSRLPMVSLKAQKMLIIVPFWHRSKTTAGYDQMLNTDDHSRPAYRITYFP